MQTAANYQDMSAVDALWTLYLQQSQWVRKAFRSRINSQDVSDEMPTLRTREEMMAVSRERMRDIIDGRERTLTHDEAMQLVDQALHCNGEDEI